MGDKHLTDEEKVYNLADADQISNYIEDQPAQSEWISKLLPDSEEGETIEKPVMLVIEDNAEVQELIATSFECAFKIYRALDGLEGW